MKKLIFLIVLFSNCTKKRNIIIDTVQSQILIKNQRTLALNEINEGGFFIVKAKLNKNLILDDLYILRLQTGTELLYNNPLNNPIEKDQYPVSIKNNFEGIKEYCNSLEFYSTQPLEKEVNYLTFKINVVPLK